MRLKVCRKLSQSSDTRSKDAEHLPSPATRRVGGYSAVLLSHLKIRRLIVKKTVR